MNLQGSSGGASRNSRRPKPSIRSLILLSSAGIGVPLLHPAGHAFGVVDVDAVGADLGGEAQVLVRQIGLAQKNLQNLILSGFREPRRKGTSMRRQPTPGRPDGSRGFPVSRLDMWFR